MTDYSKITALYSRLSVGDEDRDGGESNSIQNQKIFLENYARGQHLTNIRHYIDDDESGRFFDRSAYSRMMDDVGKRENRCLHYERPDALGARTISKSQRYGDIQTEQCALYRSQQRDRQREADTLEFAPFITSCRSGTQRTSARK